MSRSSSWCSLSRLGPVRRCAIVVRSGGWCSWCGCALTREGTQIDHVVPRRDGGRDDDANLVASCSECNLVRPDGVDVSALLALPLDLGAGRELALAWYGWAAGRFDDGARRKRDARQRAPRGGGNRAERAALRDVALADTSDGDPW